MLSQSIKGFAQDTVQSTPASGPILAKSAK
jgi:hypothetical protein